jgi:hypothetical protein
MSEPLERRVFNFIYQMMKVEGVGEVKYQVRNSSTGPGATLDPRFSGAAEEAMEKLLGDYKREAQTITAKTFLPRDPFRPDWPPNCKFFVQLSPGAVPVFYSKLESAKLLAESHILDAKESVRAIDDDEIVLGEIHSTSRNVQTDAKDVVEMVDVGASSKEVSEAECAFISTVQILHDNLSRARREYESSNSESASILKREKERVSEFEAALDGIYKALGRKGDDTDPAEMLELACARIERAAELEKVSEAFSEQLVAQATESRGLSIAEGLIRGLQAQLDRANTDVERLRRPHTDVMGSIDASCRAALGDRLDAEVVDALVDAVSEFVWSHVNATAYYREQLDRATKPRADGASVLANCTKSLAHALYWPGHETCERGWAQLIDDVKDNVRGFGQANEKIGELQALSMAAEGVLSSEPDKPRPMSEAPLTSWAHETPEAGRAFLAYARWGKDATLCRMGPDGPEPNLEDIGVDNGPLSCGDCSISFDLDLRYGLLWCYVPDVPNWENMHDDELSALLPASDSKEAGA